MEPPSHNWHSMARLTGAWAANSFSLPSRAFLTTVFSSANPERAERSWSAAHLGLPACQACAGARRSRRGIAVGACDRSRGAQEEEKKTRAFPVHFGLRGFDHPAEEDVAGLSPRAGAEEGPDDHADLLAHLLSSSGLLPVHGILC
eukprot:15172238-Alexandrium_andersonii.AAC.2